MVKITSGSLGNLYITLKEGQSGDILEKNFSPRIKIKVNIQACCHPHHKMQFQSPLLCHLHLRVTTKGLDILWLPRLHLQPICVMKYIMILQKRKEKLQINPWPLERCVKANCATTLLFHYLVSRCSGYCAWDKP